MPKAAKDATAKVATKAANNKTKEPKEKKEKRAPSAYAMFVKENMPKWKAENPDAPPKNAMAGVAAMWKDSPENPKRGQDVVPKKKKAAKVASSSDTEAAA